MPGRLFLLTLGFHENFALRRLTGHGATRGDGVLAVTLKPLHGGAKSAFQALSMFASRMGVEDISVLEVEPEDLGSASYVIAGALIKASREKGYNSIIADLTGGPRFIVVSTLISLIVVSHRLNVDIYVQSDTGGEWEHRIPGKVIEALMAVPSSDKLKLLKAIVAKPGSTPSELSYNLGLSQKTVLNYASQLKKQGLIVQKGRGAGYYPTPWGMLISLV
ncbi:MAG: CRISPR-associated CARF protein Csa3 [Desulfurococcales archaeon]|nr:CRISPR-associated CARF protein Csa3 [Desulfurococcales archaeon]